MIEREDFCVDKGFKSSNRFKQLKANDLLIDSAMRFMLKKPDFQRETRDWNIPQVTNFIISILEGHFVPSLILWQNESGVTFVIDGAHRVSTFMAWINDDYGDGEISEQFYNQKISEEQLELAKRARLKIEKAVGKYSKYKDAIKNPKKYDEETIKKARVLESFAFDIQWIEGNVNAAEKSFFNINQKAVPINKTELKILEARKQPIGIASRAIVYSGSGYKYWKNFDEKIQEEIEIIAQDINDLLFLPKTQKPLSTLDVAVAGQNQMDLQLVYDLITYSNDNISSIEDVDGTETIKILRNTKNILQVINSKQPGSLGLHPIIYFYSKKGNFKPANFFGIVLFVKELKSKKKFNKFTDVREKFENFIYKNDYIIDQINRNMRSTKNSAIPIKNLYFLIMEQLLKNADEKSILQIIKEENDNLNLSNDESNITQSSFNNNRKSETYISQAINSVIRCGICGGVVHVNSTSVDHITRKRDGGKGESNNGQITHPYCNTGYKN